MKAAKNVYKSRMDREFSDQNSEEDENLYPDSRHANLKDPGIKKDNGWFNYVESPYAQLEDIQPNSMFRNYDNCLKHLLKTKRISTDFPII